MPKIARELTPLAVRRLAARPGFHAVGGVSGLCLFVKDTGAASWVLRKVVGAERRMLGLGGFPTVDLAGARAEARRIVLLVRQGIDPVADRKAATDALRAAQAKVRTFAECARLCHAARSAEFKNAKHAAQWIATLETYAFPTLGTLDVAAIELPHVLAVLEPIWKTKTETATRVRQRIESVLAYAIVNKFRPEGMNPAAWGGMLQHALPKARKVKKRKSHPAVAWRDVSGFMLDTLKMMAAGRQVSMPNGGKKLVKPFAATLDAIEFGILTCARSQEIRFASWDQIDLNAKVWTVPAKYMKSKKVHRVPLSDAAVKLLRRLPRHAGSPLLFVTPTGKPMSDSTMSKLMREWQVPSTTPGQYAVPHGFRSSFKDWAREGTGNRYADEVSELALAHVDSDETRAAYARGELLDARRKMMADWARHCTTPAGANVVKLRAVRS